MPKGQPKKFKNEKELINLWAEFCEDIIDNDFVVVPTQTAFCKWLAENYSKTDRKTIYTSLNKYFPTIKKEFEQLQSDVIMQGGMTGKYNPTMSIFGLKNWCGWSDTGKDVSIRYNDNTAEDDALTKALKEEAERMQNAD